LPVRADPVIGDEFSVMHDHVAPALGPKAYGPKHVSARQGVLRRLV
jgi:hypothetical protein